MKGRGLLVLAAATALCFNNWLLGLVLNYNLLSQGGAVSEFSALNQPHHTVFRSLDVIAGILFVALAIAVKPTMAKLRGYNWLVYGTIVLGLANAADAFEPLKCSQTLSRSCVIPVQVSLSHPSIPSHGYSSIAIAICYLLLPVAGWVYAMRLNSKRFVLISIVLAAISTAYLIAAVAEYLITGTFSDKAWGPTQEVQMVVLGAWFVVWARAISSKTTRSH